MVSKYGNLPAFVKKIGREETKKLLCAKLCSLKKEVVLPILDDRTDLTVADDGTYTRNSTGLDVNNGLQKGER